MARKLGTLGRLGVAAAVATAAWSEPAVASLSITSKVPNSLVQQGRLFDAGGIPVAGGLSFRETRTWAEQLSKTIGAVVPDLVSWEWDKRERGGRARLDYTQNVHHKTLVAPYSPRAAPGAPVSAPIGWDELDDPSLRPDGFTIRTELDRVAARGDEFRAALGEGQQLPPIS